jgi:hypothetical protein
MVLYHVYPEDEDGVIHNLPDSIKPCWLHRPCELLLLIPPERLPTIPQMIIPLKNQRLVTL